MLQNLFMQVLELSAVASVLCVVVALLRLFLKKAPKKYVLVLWLLVFIKLCVPFYFKTPYSPFNVPQTINNIYTGNTALPLPSINNENNNITTPNAPQTNQSGLTTTTPIFETKQFSFSLFVKFAPYVWLGGTAIMLLYYLFATRRVKRSMRIMFKNHSGCYVSDKISAPILCGIIRPKICIPRGMSPLDINYIIAHEKMHIKYFDHVLKPLAYFVLCAHWFNPFAWLAFGFMSKDMEMRCDENVVKSLSAQGKKEYSELLFNFASPTKQSSPVAVTFGEHSAKSRIKNILSFKKPTLWVTLLCIMIIACVVFVFTTQKKQQTPDNIDNSQATVEKDITPAKIGALTNDKAYTFTQIEQIAGLHNENYIDSGAYNFLRTMLGYSPLKDFESEPNYSDIKISEFEVIYTPAVFTQTYVFDFNFTVESSPYDTLPKGKYEKEVFSGRFLQMQDKNYDESKEEIYTSNSTAVQSTISFINSIYVWNTPWYGRVDDYSSLLNYIVKRYGSNGEIRLSDFIYYAGEHFGAYDKSVDSLSTMITNKNNEPYVTAGGIGGAGASMSLVSVNHDLNSNTETIVIQFYADYSKIIKSHLVEYILQGERFLECNVLEESQYQPVGLMHFEYENLAPTVFTNTNDLDENDYSEGFIKALLTNDVDVFYNTHGYAKGMLEDLKTVEFDKNSIYIEKDKFYNFKVNFTVLKSEMDTLPVGEHSYFLPEGMHGLYFETVKPYSTEVSPIANEVSMLTNYLSDETVLLPKDKYDSSTSLYVLLKLQNKYPEKTTGFTAQELTDYAKKHLKLEKFEVVETDLDKNADGTYFLPGRGGSHTEHVITSVKAMPDRTTAVEVQFFADNHGLVKSNLVTYYLSGTEGDYVFERAEIADPKSKWPPAHWAV